MCHVVGPNVAGQGVLSIASMMEMIEARVTRITCHETTGEYGAALPSFLLVVCLLDFVTTPYNSMITVITVITVVDFILRCPSWQIL